MTLLKSLLEMNYGDMRNHSGHRDDDEPMRTNVIRVVDLDSKLSYHTDEEYRRKWFEFSDNLLADVDGWNDLDDDDIDHAIDVGKRILNI